MRIFDVDSIAPSERGSLTDQLLPEEAIQHAFRAASTTILFTDRRILTMQLHVLLTERLETSSFSYRYGNSRRSGAPLPKAEAK